MNNSPFSERAAVCPKPAEHDFTFTSWSLCTSSLSPPATTLELGLTYSVS
jgi:hypothetical protein